MVPTAVHQKLKFHRLISEEFYFTNSYLRASSSSRSSAQLYPNRYARPVQKEIFFVTAEISMNVIFANQYRAETTHLYAKTNTALFCQIHAGDLRDKVHYQDDLIPGKAPPRRPLHLRLPVAAPETCQRR